MVQNLKLKKHFQDYKDFLTPPKRGALIKGIVLGKDKRGVFLDLENYKTGIVRKDDLKYGGKSISKIEKGDELMVKIIGEETKSGFVKVSLKEARKDIIWEKFLQWKEKKETLNLKVVSANKGGLLFKISSIQGILPVSQLSKDNKPQLKEPTPEKIFQELKKFVGKDMKVKIITVEKDKEKLILKEA